MFIQNSAFAYARQKIPLTPQPALEAALGQMDGFLSQLSYKYHLDEEASVRDLLKICRRLDSRVDFGRRRGTLWLPLRGILNETNNKLKPFWQ